MRAHDTDDLALLDRPEVLSCLFYPRKELPEIPVTPKAMTFFITVDKGISIGCRFYPTKKEAAVIFYFHGNGEIASDYDYVAPLYNEIGINLFVADYRGYGLSNGEPTATALIKDAHALFHGFVKFLEELSYKGDIIIMGRSLGSVPALEVAVHYQHGLTGLIIESGFSNTMTLVDYFGFAELFAGIKNFKGFGNGDKIKAVSLPTLVIHAEKDRLIPASEGRELYDLSGSTRKRLVIIPGAGHNDIMVKGREQYFREIETFIRMVSG
ncbi:MAG TPA: alpha/beta fold hydrolase [Thermodesulfobacteriota bacterium]|nr:alpha/beta fold hydrolase [Thermodesulfobacteriota bacterium]